TLITGNQQKALFVGISNSGETKEVIKLMQLANKAGCQTMAITQFGKNSLSEEADVTIRHVRANEQLSRMPSSACKQIQFYVEDILSHTYALEHCEKIGRTHVRSQ